MTIKIIILLAIELQNVLGPILIKPLRCSTSLVNSLGIFSSLQFASWQYKILAGLKAEKQKQR